MSISSGKQITVFGCGSWGGVLACYLESLGHHVSVWHRSGKTLDNIQAYRKHPNLKNLHFPDTILFSSDLDIGKSAELAVIAVPSHAVRGLIGKATQVLPEDTLIVNVAKGLEQDTLSTMSQLISESGRIESHKIISLSGPSHAEEVLEQLPTALVAASASLAAAEQVQHIFSSKVLRVYTNSDIIGVELGGSLKNVIAIAAGICDGIGFGDNTIAALITRGIKEISRLGVKFNADPKTFNGLSGIGDLIATCMSPHSRNRYVGEALGKGEKIESILENMEMVAEGINTAKTVKKLQTQYDVDLPISSAVYSILFEDQDPRLAVHELMTRDLIGETR